MTAAALKDSATADSAPPPGLTPELRALWFTKAGRWEEAHNIAQDIHTAVESSHEAGAVVLGALIFDESLSLSDYGGFLLLAAGLLVIDGRLFRRFARTQESA